MFRFSGFFHQVLADFVHVARSDRQDDVAGFRRLAQGLFQFLKGREEAGAFVAGASSPVNSSRNSSIVKSRCSSPFFVNDTAPVSSDTTTVTLSVTSLMPSAARWRVPSSFEINGLSDNGK